MKWTDRKGWNKMMNGRDREESYFAENIVSCEYNMLCRGLLFGW